MLSRADYFEHLFNQFADELTQASRHGELERPLDLRRELAPTRDGTLYLTVQIVDVPHCAVNAAIGRKPYQHDR
jgi:hypothetical protein